jgi:hypothetical protein
VTLLDTEGVKYLQKTTRRRRRKMNDPQGRRDETWELPV